MATTANVNINVNSSQVTQATQNLGGLQSALGSVTSGAGGTSSALSALGTAAGVVGLSVAAIGAAAVAAGGFLLGMANDAIEAADGMRDLSSQSNLSIERLSVLSAAYKTTAVSLNEVIAGAEALSSKLAKQDEVSGKVAVAIAKLGVARKDENGEMKSAIQLQEDIIVAASEATDKQEAEALAVLALGTTYYKLRGSVLEVKESKSELYDLMARTGGVVTKELGDASDNLNDKLTNMKTVMGGVGNSIAAIALPMLNKLAQVALDTADAVARAIARIAGTNSMSDKVDRSLSTLKEQREEQERYVANQEKGLNARTERGQKEIADGKAKIENLKEQERLLGRQLEASKKIEEVNKKAAIEGTKGEGTTTDSGRGTKTPKEKKEKEKKERDEYTPIAAKLSAEIKSANADEQNGAQKLNAAQKEKITLQERYTSGLLKITPEQFKQLNAQLDQLSVLQDYNAQTAEAAKNAEAKAKKDEQYRKQQAELWAQEADNVRDFIDQNYTIQKQITIVNELKKQGLITDEEQATALKKYNDLLMNTQNTFSAGWENALKKYSLQSQDAAKQGEDAFNTFSHTIEDSLNKFIETGKFKFSDFARSVIVDIGKMASKAAASGIMKLLGGGGGGGDSGGGIWGTILSGIAGYASGYTGGTGGVQVLKNDGSNYSSMRALGGPAYGDTLVGENGPEVISPRTPSMVTPNNKLGGQTNNITINVSGSEKPEETAQAINEKLVKTMQGIARGEIMNATRRGNVLNPL